ncbi:MAG: phenylacetate--CoA ligase family protein [Verrucomicrobiales bacterium]
MNPLRNRWASLPGSTLRRLQAQQFRWQLEHVVLPFSSYYRELFEREGLKASQFRDLTDLSAIPFSSKADLVNTSERPEQSRRFVLIPDKEVLSRRPSTLLRALTQGPAAAKAALQHEWRPVFLTSTTGRSADPVPFLFTGHDLHELEIAGVRTMQIAGGTPDMRMMNVFPFAPHLAFWLAHYAGTGFGVFMLSTGGGKVMGTEGNIRMMKKIQPDVMIGMPTFLYHLMNEAVEDGHTNPNLKKLVLGGEKAPQGLRRKLKELAAKLGAKQVDVIATYGFTEAKMAWIECPGSEGEKHTGYHVSPDQAIIEVVDPKTGDPVEEGQSGEIVFTPLQARGSVVMRYRTGDLISGGLHYETCPHCGRTMPRLVGTISRVSEVREMNLAKLKGTLLDFNELENLLDDTPGVGSWQIEIRKLHDDPMEIDEVILHLEDPGESEQGDVEDRVRRRFVAYTETQPNRIEFHSASGMRKLHGVGEQLKEQKLVDHRPTAKAPTAERSPA